MGHPGKRRRVIGGKPQKTSRGQVIQDLKGHVINSHPKDKSNEKPLEGFKREDIYVAKNKQTKTVLWKDC